MYGLPALFKTCPLCAFANQSFAASRTVTEVPEEKVPLRFATSTLAFQPLASEMDRNVGDFFGRPVIGS